MRLNVIYSATFRITFEVFKGVLFLIRITTGNIIKIPLLFKS